MVPERIVSLPLLPGQVIRRRFQAWRARHPMAKVGRQGVGVREFEPPGHPSRAVLLARKDGSGTRTYVDEDDVAAPGLTPFANLQTTPKHCPVNHQRPPQPAISHRLIHNSPLSPIRYGQHDYFRNRHFPLSMHRPTLDPRLPANIHIPLMPETALLLLLLLLHLHHNDEANRQQRGSPDARI